MSSIDIIIIVASLLTIYGAFSHGWRLSSDASLLITRFRVKKRVGVKLQHTTQGLLRKGKRPLWDGFCHIATDSNGIYVASLFMPHMYVPFGQVEIVGIKRIWFIKYTLLAFKDYPELTWCLPPNVLPSSFTNQDGLPPNKSLKPTHLRGASFVLNSTKSTSATAVGLVWRYVSWREE